MVPNVISDDADCPGRGRMAGEGAIGRVREDEMPDGANHPGSGAAQHPEFKGKDKSPDAAACPSRGRVVGRDVRFGTCVKGLDVVKRTELDVVSRTELDVVKRTELDVVTGTELDVFSQG